MEKGNEGAKNGLGSVGTAAEPSTAESADIAFPAAGFQPRLHIPGRPPVPRPVPLPMSLPEGVEEGPDRRLLT